MTQRYTSYATVGPAASAEPVAPVALEPVARDWPSIQTAIDEYLDGYELIGEPGGHTPTEFEKFLLTDAIAGLLGDEKFLGLLAAPVATQAQPVLYQHDDGRYGLSFGPARFAINEPAWHRLPIDVIDDTAQPSARGRIMEDK